MRRDLYAGDIEIGAVCRIYGICLLIFTISGTRASSPKVLIQSHGKGRIYALCYWGNHFRTMQSSNFQRIDVPLIFITESKEEFVAASACTAAATSNTCEERVDSFSCTTTSLSPVGVIMLSKQDPTTTTRKTKDTWHSLSCCSCSS